MVGWHKARVSLEERWGERGKEAGRVQGGGVNLQPLPYSLTSHFPIQPSFLYSLLYPLPIPLH